MKFVYFIRHGEGYHNLMNYNYHNWHLLYPRLTTKGINQCYNVKETLESDKFDLIIVSPLRRTLETAEYIFNKNNNFIANDNIREFVSNPCDYRETVSEISKSFDYVNFQLVNDNDNINKKETEDDILNRVINFYKYLEELPDGKYAVVSHYAFLKRFINKYGKNLNIDNSEFNNCECKIGKF